MEHILAISALGKKSRGDDSLLAATHTVAGQQRGYRANKVASSMGASSERSQVVCMETPSALPYHTLKPYPGGGSQTINALGKKARDGTLSIDEMAGGTFTISNGGVYGSLLSTPIINPPQSAILGMHSINPRAAVRPVTYGDT